MNRVLRQAKLDQIWAKLRLDLKSEFYEFMDSVDMEMMVISPSLELQGTVLAICAIEMAEIIGSLEDTWNKRLAEVTEWTPEKRHYATEAIACLMRLDRIGIVFTCTLKIGFFTPCSIHRPEVHAMVTANAFSYVYAQSKLRDIGADSVLTDLAS